MRIVVLSLLCVATFVLVLSTGIFNSSPFANDRLNREYIKYLESRREILDLALEFGFDPMIVEIVRFEAARQFKAHYCNCSTWRFVRTDRELSYILLSIIQVESRGNFQAINIPNGPSSGIGLTQLLLSTARDYNKNITQRDLMTIPDHLHIAVQYFITLLERYNGNYTLAVISWNRGPSAVDRSIALGNSPENGYARKVFTQAALRNAR